MDGPTRPPHVSGSGSGTVTPTNAPLKRSFDDLGSDDTLSVDGSGSSSTQTSTNGDNDRNKRPRSRSPLPIEGSDAERSVPSSYQSLASPTVHGNPPEPSTAGTSNVVLIDASHVSRPPQVSSVSSNPDTTSISALGVEIQVIEPLAPDPSAAQIAARATPPMAIPAPGTRNTPFTSPISVASSATIGNTPARIETRRVGDGRPASPTNRATSSREDVLSRAREFQATVDAIRAIGPLPSEPSASTLGHSSFSIGDRPNDIAIQTGVRETSSRSTVVPGQPAMSNISMEPTPSVVITLDPYSLEHVASLEESPPSSPDVSGAGDDQRSLSAHLSSHLRTALVPPLRAGESAGDRTLQSSILSWDASGTAEFNSSSPRLIIQQRTDTGAAPVMNSNSNLPRSLRRVRVPLTATSGPENHNTIGRSREDEVMDEQYLNRSGLMTNPREPNVTQVNASLPLLPRRRQDPPLIPLRPLQSLPPLRSAPTAPPASNRINPSFVREADRPDMQRATSRGVNPNEPSIRVSIDISPPLSPSSSTSSFSDDIWNFSDTTHVSTSHPPHERHNVLGRTGRTRRIWDHTTGISYDVPIDPPEDTPEFSWTSRHSRGAPRTSQPLDPSLSSPYPSSFEPALIAGSSSQNVGATFPPALGPIERHTQNTSADNRPVSPPLSPASFVRTFRPPRSRPRESVANIIARRRAADAGRRTEASTSTRHSSTASGDAQTNPRRLPPFPPGGPSRPPMMSEFVSGISQPPALEPTPASPPSLSVGYDDLMEEYLADLAVESGGPDPPVVHLNSSTTTLSELRDRGHAPSGPIPEFTPALHQMRGEAGSVAWTNSPAPGDTAWVSDARPINPANPVSRVEEPPGWPAYAQQPPSQTLETRALVDARVSRGLRTTDREARIAHSESRRPITPIPPGIGIRWHGGEAPPATSELRPYQILDVGHLNVSRLHHNTGRQHVQAPGRDGRNDSFEVANPQEPARHQTPEMIASSNSSSQQAQTQPSLPHHPSYWSINFNSSTVNRGEDVGFAIPPIPRVGLVRESADDHYAARNSLGIRPSEHRTNAIAPLRSARGAPAPQLLEEWTSSTSAGTSTDARTSESERALQSPSPNMSWALEQEINRLRQIMQEARESAHALMRYADRIPISASPRASSRPRLSTRAQYSPNERPSNTNWEGRQEDAFSDLRMGRPSGVGHMTGDPDYAGDITERQRARLTERRRIRDLADDVQRAASGVDRIIGFMGREGRAELRETRPQRTPQNNSERSGTTNTLPTEGFSGARGLSNSAALPPAFIAGAHPLRGPRYDSRAEAFDVSYPSDAAGLSMSGHLSSGSSFSGSLSTSSRPSRSQYLEPTGTSSSDNSQSEVHSRAMRFQQYHRRRLAPVQLRTGFTRDNSHPGPPPRSGFFRAGRVENVEDRPFHQIFAAHRHANRDYIPDANWDASYESLIRLGTRIGEARSRHTPAEILSTLQRGTFREFPNPTNETRCPICLDDYTDNDTVLAMHPCTHFFHSDCLRQWLQTSRSCPNCRTGVQMRMQSETRAARPREHTEPSSAGANLTQQTAPPPIFSTFNVIHHASQTSSPATSVFPMGAAFDLHPSTSTEQTERSSSLPSEDMDQDSQDARRGRQP